MLILLSLLHGARSQEKNSLIPLKDALESIESKLNVSFSYADENIIGIFIPQFSASLNLNEILDFLSEQTGLIYTPIDNRTIAITTPPATIPEICGIIYGADKTACNPAC